jgi:transposase-like protein
MAEEKMTSVEAVFKAVEGAPADLLRELLEVIVTRVMGAEVSALCGAGYGERRAERVNTRNCYRSRPWDTRLGTIDLAIPKLRQGSYFPTWLLEPRRRAERALVAVVAESYVLGVSTRKVEDLVQTLGIAAMSKSQMSQLAKSLDATVASFRERPLDGGPYPYVWLDAMALRCREGGRTVHVAALVGGRREC